VPLNGAEQSIRIVVMQAKGRELQGLMALLPDRVLKTDAVTMHRTLSIYILWTPNIAV
jgi:hypothetical protein